VFRDQQELLEQESQDLLELLEHKGLLEQLGQESLDHKEHKDHKEHRDPRE